MDKPFDLVGSIIAYESGDLDAEGTLELFGHLIRTGQAWSLQGSYGRAAASLIENDILTEQGELTPKARKVLSDA